MKKKDIPNEVATSKGSIKIPINFNLDPKPMDLIESLNQAVRVSGHRAINFSVTEHEKSNTGDHIKEIRITIEELSEVDL